MERGAFVELDHTADLGLELYGPTPGAVLEAAQRGLVHVLFGETPGFESREVREIELAATSWPDLLKAWLESLYRLLEEEAFVALESRVETQEPARLTAKVLGAIAERDAIAHASELKAVTYHQLAFEPSGEGWGARVIFDV
jgi:SHS2 domain-containing protein